MKIRNISGLFDEQNVLEKLTQLGDPLVLIKEHIDFGVYKDLLNKFFNRDEEAKAGRGRPGYDVVTMLKILFVQRLYNLSDEQIEFQINDRLSFRRFLHIAFSDAVPDCKTVWAFKETLKVENYTEDIFNTFLEQLAAKNLIAKEGKMLDATIVSVPIQRNSRGDNEEIKMGITPKAFIEKPNKLRQKDTEARWTKKHNKNYFGYKNHVKADAKNKFILNYKITDASVHDSQVCVDLLNEKDRAEPFYADSAYQTPEIKEKLADLKMHGQIVEKGYRNKPLTDGQNASNKTISKTRARVEHIFGFMYNSMNDGMFVRTIGKKRATLIIGLNNWVYNICRYTQLKKSGIA